MLLLVQPAAGEQAALSLEEMVAAADEIVVGEVEASAPEWDGRLIVTVSRVRVEESLKGRPSGRLEVVQYGGTAVHPRLGQPVTMTASGVSLLRKGEEVVLLVKEARRGRRQVVGGGQGAFRVERGAAAGAALVPTAPERLRVDPAPGARRLRAETETLEGLRERILEHVERQRARPAGSTGP